MATADKEKNSAYEYPYRRDYEQDWDQHSKYVQTFDAYEAMLLGQVYDSVSRTVDTAKITDSYAATLAKERADRVMAKLPEGETVSVGKADAGKAAFMDILRQKWIYPNANAQHPFAIKLNMWQLYSDVYGYMPMFYDWHTNYKTGYVGPDCWLLNPRTVIPQQGRVSVEDMDYLTVETYVGHEMLENLLEDSFGEEKTDQLEEGVPTRQGEENEDENDGWNLAAVQELLSLAKEATTGTDTARNTVAERSRVPNAKRKGIRLCTRYEAGDEGEWITFAPDYGYCEVRRLKNPHKNGRIPIIIKYSQALYDSFYGLGRFQRAKPLQAARDGLTNFYFKGIKMNLIPPLVINANGVLKHTIDYREGSVMMETQPNSVRQLNTSMAGLSTYQGAMSNMTGSLLSLFGSQNASLPGADTLNPSQGKTPQAISLYGDKEATQDGADLRNLQSAIEQLTDGFFSIVGTIGTEDIPVTLYAKDIQEIAESGLADIEGLFENFTIDKSGMVGELKIKPSAFKDIEMRFNIAPGSTLAKNKADNLAEWERMVSDIAKFQNIFKDDPNIEVNWGKIMEAGEALSNIRGAKDFITVKEGPTQQEQQLQQQLQQLQQENQDLKNKAAQSQGQQKPLYESLQIKFSDLPEDAKQEVLASAGFPTNQVTPGTMKDHVDMTAKLWQQHINSKKQATTTTATNQEETAEPVDNQQEDMAEPAAPMAPAGPQQVGPHMFNDPQIADAARSILG